MKTNNIFDYLKTDPENIDEATIYENTGVDKKNVREIVMKKVHESAAPKKNKRKTITISLIAAAAAVAVLGTTAAATGSFHAVFGEWFAGEMQGGMYAGGHVQSSSNDLNVDFKGVVGDKHDAYGMMTITKKDGSAFVENTDDYFIGSSMSSDTVDCTISAWDQMMDKLMYYQQEMRYGEVGYDLADANTINAYVHYGSEGFNIIGETLTVKESSVVLYHVDKILCTSQEIDAYWAELREKNIGTVNSDETIFAKTAEPYVDSLKDDQTTIITPKGDWAIVTTSSFDLSYDLSVQLNYKDTSRSFPNASGMKVTYNNAEMTIKNLEAMPFAIRIDMLYPTEDQQKIQNNFNDTLANQIDVTMKDGTVYHGNNPSSYTSDNVERVSFSFYTDYKMVVIDPQNIAKIVYNGVTLYSE